MLQETLAYEVLSVVEEIPAGKVATYGQIARLIGRPRNARLVGRILRGAEQAALLAAEGVFLNQRGCVDLARDQWDC